MSNLSRRFARAPQRGPLPSQSNDIAADHAFIFSSAVSLSTSALFAALVLHLEAEGILSPEDQRAIYERAVELLRAEALDDELNSATELAREIIEQQLRPN